MKTLSYSGNKNNLAIKNRLVPNKFHPIFSHFLLTICFDGAIQ